jgi:hypothetical protein
MLFVFVVNMKSMKNERWYKDRWMNELGLIQVEYWSKMIW